VALSGPAAAQSGSSIEGTVVDETGGALPGVTVIAASPALLVKQMEAYTDGEGRYRFPDMPIGAYTLTFRLPGFKALERSGMTLTAGFTMRVDVAMEIGGIEETVVVTGEAAIVDMSSTRGGQLVQTERLTTVLPGNRTIADLVNMTPGMENNAGQDAGAIGQSARPRFRMYGMNSSNTNSTIMIDGFSVIANNPVPNVGATAEVDVKTFGNTADIKEIGAAMNMVLKSGGDTFHGGAAIENQQQPGDNITDELKDRGLSVASEFDYFYDVGGELGGRIIREKLWFFGSLRYRQSSVGRAGLVKDAGPDGIYRTGDEEAHFPILKAGNSLGKMTWQITPKYSVNASFTDDFNKESAQIQGQQYSETPFQSTSVMDWEPYTWKTQFKGTPTNQSLFDAQFGHSGYHIYREYQPTCSGPQKYDEEAGLYDGCRNNQYGDSIFDFYVGDANFSFLPISEHLGAKHEFKMGYHFSRRANSRIRWLNDEWGSYQLTFDSPAGLLNPFSVPVEFEASNAPVEPKVSNIVHSVYFMDQFRVGSRLTFNAGLRIEHENDSVPDQCREAGQFPFAAAQCYDGREVGSWTYLAPRAAMAWDLTGTGSSVLKVGFGYFIPEAALAGGYTPTGGYDVVYRWNDPNGNGLYDPGEVNFDLNGPDYLSGGGGELAIINPDLELENIREYSVTYEQSITNTSAFRLMYLRRQFRNDIADSNVARPYDAWTVALTRRDPGPDGRLDTGDAGDGTPVTIYEYPAAFAGQEFERELEVNKPDDRNNWNQTFEIAANQRGDIWSASGSFSATEVYQYLAAVPQSPNDEVNGISDIWEWSAKFNGSVRLPYDINMGTIVSIRSPVRGTRTYTFRASDPDGGPRLQQLRSVNLRMEEPGSQKENAVPTVNLRLSKRFNLGGEQMLNFSFDIINIGNASGIRSVRYSSGGSFGQVRDIQPPRQFRFGVKYSF
jgi:hypothetical protein